MSETWVKGMSARGAAKRTAKALLGSENAWQDFAKLDPVGDIRRATNDKARNAFHESLGFAPGGGYQHGPEWEARAEKLRRIKRLRDAQYQGIVGGSHMQANAMGIGEGIRGVHSMYAHRGPEALAAARAKFHEQVAQHNLTSLLNSTT